MNHTTHTTHTTQAPASQITGSIAGFHVTCSCGFAFKSSLRTMADQDARDHVAFMARKESDAAWRALGGNLAIR